MGVNHLWDILAPVGCRVPLEELQDETVAIDLSGWILESFKLKELSHIRKPHIRNLFYRISSLLHLGIKPVFVLEGIAPDMKKTVLSKRLNSDEEKSMSLCSRKHFASILKECKELIENLGLVCVQSSGEAEATCAYLNNEKVVNGCVTDDSDAFLYGARTVYRDFSTDPKDPHVVAYHMDDIERELGLDRRKLVALAVLLGCDYNQSGVSGVGKEKAMKLLQKLKDKDILERFDQWKNGDLFSSVDTSLLNKKSLSHCNKCKHPGSDKKHSMNGCHFCVSESCCFDNENPCPCEWHKAREVELEFNISRRAICDSEFPYKNIMQEYLGFKETFKRISLDWKRPSWTNLQNFLSRTLGWTVEMNREKIIPLITLWQITMPDKTENGDVHILAPVRIIKECKRKFQKSVIVEWEWIRKNDDVEPIKETTTELKEHFERRYPKLMDDYEAISGKKNDKKIKRKKNTVDSNQLEVRNNRNSKELFKDLEVISMENNKCRVEPKELNNDARQNKELSAVTKDLNSLLFDKIREPTEIKQKSRRELLMDSILRDDESDLSDLYVERDTELATEHNIVSEIDESIIIVNSFDQSNRIIIIDSDDELPNGEEEEENYLQKKRSVPHKREKDLNIYDYSPLPLRDRLKILKL